MRVAIASLGWDYPATSFSTHAADVLAAAVSVGIDAVPMHVASSRDLRVGGLLRPTWRRMFVAYARTPGELVHCIDHECLRDPDVVTVHDLGMFHPDAGAPMSVGFSRWSIRDGARRAKRVIVTTVPMREEFARLLPRYVHKVRVVPVPHAPVAAGRSALEYDALWIGRNAPNKHLAEYIELARRFPGSRFGLRWSKSPGRPAMDAALRATIPWPSNIVEFDRPLTAEGMDALYRSTRIVVSTSDYEGWHRPITEGYARGSHIVVPRLEPYVSLYPKESAFWYVPDSRESLDAAFTDALNAPLRPPSPAVYESMSYSVVGQQLKAVYEEIAGA